MIVAMSKREYLIAIAVAVSPSSLHSVPSAPFATLCISGLDDQEFKSV